MSIWTINRLHQVLLFHLIQRLTTLTWKSISYSKLSLYATFTCNRGQNKQGNMHRAISVISGKSFWRFTPNHSYHLQCFQSRCSLLILMSFDFFLFRFGFAYIGFSDSSSPTLHSNNILVSWKQLQMRVARRGKKKELLLTVFFWPFYTHIFLESCQSPLMEEEECFK